MKKLNRIIITSTVVVPAAFMVAFTAASGAGQIMEAYERNNPAYQKIQIQNEINTYSGQKYQTGINNVMAQIDNITNNISAAEAQLLAYQEEGNAIGALNCRLQIASLESQLIEARKSHADYTLQLDNANYYIQYSDEITDMQQRKQKHSFLQQIISVSVYESQTEYCKASVKQLEELKKAEEAKMRLGYSIAISVDELEAQLAAAKAEQSYSEGQLELLNDVVSQNANKYYSSDFELSDCGKISSSEAYLEKFYENNPVSEQYELQLIAYDSYIAALNGISGTEAEIQAANLQKNSISLELEQYKINLSLYVKGKVIEYDTLQDQLSAKEKEISVCEEKISASKILLKKGKIKSTDVTSLETELAKLKFDKINILSQLNITYSILENQIEI